MLHSRTGELIPPWRQKFYVSVSLVSWISRSLLICCMLSKRPLYASSVFLCASHPCPKVFKISDFLEGSAIICFKGYSLAEIIRHIFGLATVHLEANFCYRGFYTAEQFLCLLYLLWQEGDVISKIKISQYLWPNSSALSFDKLEAKFFFYSIDCIP